MARVLRIAFVIINNIYCIPAYVVWMMLLQPIKIRWPHIYWRCEGLLFHWLLSMVSLWADTAGYKVAELGDDISRCLESKTLVIANHQSTADVPLLMSAFNTKPGVLPKLMWIMDHLFKYTNFGVVSVLHGDFFISAGKNKREASIAKLEYHLTNFFIPIGRQWIVLFPEGGFLRKRKETSHKFAAKNNLPLLNNVSLPRVGALKAIMNVMGTHKIPSNNCTNSNSKKLVYEDYSEAIFSAKDSKVEWILDITIAFEDGKPINLPNIVTGSKPPCTTLLHYRIFPSTDIPDDEEGTTKWLYDRFIEKEHMLEYFYKNGHFPEECPDGVKRNNVPKLIKQNYFRFFYTSLFYIISTIIQIRLFIFLYASLSSLLNVWVV